MYFIIIEAVPRPAHPRRDEFGGAFAACWVATDDAVVAEREARAVLADAEWEPRDVEDHFPVERAQYVGNDELLALYDRAVADGVAINLNTWPARKRKKA
ncbi:hypothetical protein [Roseisolibacter sp. H3M3-2]|uniref:hypothetical protein n=1 Tax=Roseisolibacter sp. H3M3-2 TaxID=3031323 RepID=UPI0023D9FBD5|nr:hypothetical protein [Roseisolibacter sp. H3M3-2]MDF1503847.1 hypothetical protein [Roseisolibacter sp. H3M3-2]